MSGFQISDVSVPSIAMQWAISCDLTLDVVEPAEVVLQITAAPSAGEVIHEDLRVALDDRLSRSVMEVLAPDGARFHIVQVDPGLLTVSYSAAIRSITPTSSVETVTEQDSVVPASSLSYDRQMFLRPSRYCPSDRLVGFAVAEFGTGPDVATRVTAITEWIGQRVSYVLGSSTVHDSAEDTLLIAKGTCRDFAHLGVALSRATGVPARFVAVYAPGLSPMDFHAVFETFEDGHWCVHDATGLAPRQSLVRVVTGRDAADTAFVAINDGLAELASVEITATVEPFLPTDDHRARVTLA